MHYFMSVSDRSLIEVCRRDMSSLCLFLSLLRAMPAAASFHDQKNRNLSLNKLHKAPIGALCNLFKDKFHKAPIGDL